MFRNLRNKTDLFKSIYKNSSQNRKSVVIPSTDQNNLRRKEEREVKEVITTSDNL